MDANGVDSRFWHISVWKVFLSTYNERSTFE
jgi:hypothetical protein